MGKRVILVDDLTNQESESVKTVIYMVNGAYYEIELSDESMAKFDKALAPYIKVSRAASRIRAVAVTALDESQKIRAWARDNGKDISERGRIPQEIVDEYHKVNGAN